jgi:hypothetical protein
VNFRNRRLEKPNAAKLEGILSANETSLIEKKLAVEDLEQRLSMNVEEKRRGTLF